MRIPTLVLALAVVLVHPCSSRGQDGTDANDAEGTVERLLLEALESFRAKKYAAARTGIQEALAVAEKHLGPDDPHVATCLDGLAHVAQATGDLKGATPLLERALAIREKNLGPEHPETARTLNDLGCHLRDVNDPKAARPYLERALAIEEKILPPDDPATITTQNNLASVLSALGDWQAARPLLERAVSTMERVRGAEHPDTATCLNNLACLLQDVGELDGARNLHERALRIREKALGPDHVDTAMSVANLGTLLRDVGDPQGALPMCERSLALYERIRGPEHPDTATCLSNLGLVLADLGDLERARASYERALAIREKAHGRESPALTGELRGLGGVLRAMGDLQGARVLMERALRLYERALGPDHPRTALALNDLALLLSASGDHEGARRRSDRALGILEASLGKEHPALATVLETAAGGHLRTGDAKAARTLYERVLAIRRRTLGQDHPDTAGALNNLAAAAARAADWKGAERAYREAIDVRERVLGPDHPLTSLTLNNLAHVLRQSGDVEGAREMYERAWRANREDLQTLLPHLSSRERCAAVQSRAAHLACYIDSFLDRPESSWAAALAWKGAALRATTASLRLPPDASAEARRLLDELTRARAALARVALSPTAPKPGERGPAETYHALRRDVEELERKLAVSLPGLHRLAWREVQAAEVKDALGPHGALLDLLENQGVMHAWVVRQGEAVRYFPLGDAREIDPIVARFRHALESDDRALWEQAGKELRARLEGALAAALDGAEVLYLSPDGPLATAPLGLLPDGEGGNERYLFERLPIVHTMGGAGMVMASERHGTDAGQSLAGFGDVDYSALDRRFAQLPETRKEVECVTALLRACFPDAECRIWSGKDADEATFVREAGKARCVHVATHGFFDSDRMPSESRDDVRGVTGGKVAIPLEAFSPESTGVAGWNPMLLSGIVLAPGGGEDGLLTAEELQGMDLGGVDLIVLSACETGRGQSADGEGVLGLSRALSIAGARAFMLSLWPVPDEPTREAMDDFYRALWSGAGGPPEQALRVAQLRAVERDRSAGRFRPSAWGAWILFR